MKIFTFLIFIVLHKLSLSIRILTTEEHIEDWNPEGKIAELNCPTLKGLILGCKMYVKLIFIATKISDHKETTLCGRFKTFNFIGEEQHIISIDSQVKN